MTFEQEQTVNRLKNTGEFVTIKCTDDMIQDLTFRSNVRYELLTGEVLIEFTKTNGETRVMRGTTSERLGAKHTSTVHLDEGSESSGKSIKKQNLEVCQIWDTKIGAWRSFRWSNLKKVEYINK
jgi:hypothetical protein